MAIVTANFNAADLDAALCDFIVNHGVQVVKELPKESVQMVYCDRHLDWIDYVDNKLDKIVGRLPAKTPKSKHYVGKSLFITVRN